MEKKIVYHDGDDYIVFERYDHGDGERWCLYHIEETVNDWGEPIATRHGYMYNLHRSDVAILSRRITEEGGYTRHSVDFANA